jgi:serine/threonine-protein kinase
VGALLFVLLTGKMPTAGKAVTLSQELPVLPPALDAVLTKALASDPADRYADLFAMSHDLSMATRSPRAAVKPPASPPGKTPRSAASRARAASQPAPAISGFPEPMPMPAIDMAIFDQPLQMPEIASAVATAMPAPPPVPTVDWDSLLQPVDLSVYGGLAIELPHDEGVAAAPDPMLAAVQAVRSVDSRPPRPTRSQSTRQRTAAAPAQASAPAAAPPPSPGRGARRRKRTK